MKARDKKMKVKDKKMAKCVVSRMVVCILVLSLLVGVGFSGRTAKADYTYALNVSLEGIAIRLDDEQAADIDSIRGQSTFTEGDIIYFNFACSLPGKIKSLEWKLYYKSGNTNDLEASLEQSANGSTISSSNAWIDSSEFRPGSYYLTVTPTTVYGEVLDPLEWEFELLPKGGTGSSTPASEKSKQTISGVSSRKVTYDYEWFDLGAQAPGYLTYSSSNNNVVTVSDTGRVYVKGYGRATITIRAAATSEYYATSKNITITVVPSKMKITKASSPSKGMLSYKWKKNSSVTGYQICLYDKKGSKTTKNLSKGKTSLRCSAKRGRKYYMKIRAYKTVGNKKYYGAWSAPKGVKVR